ncbi:uncharacterized protein LOC105690164 [Athalia rosae]|uniref:uncharacterized protein LOC105690164 n=1 Tax=Athalia rosae TaxID=37344 RepID=UPI002033C5CB|nr:uncharacterized protein LOC105690164 [Athalia rosae]
MKVHIVVVAVIVSAVVCHAVPRSKRQADSDPRLSNEVIPGTLEAVEETSPHGLAATTDDDLDDISLSQGETTKTPALDDAPTPSPGNKRKKPLQPQSSDTFSRVIDDIFNIPISVLRAVNTLISNAFGTKQGATASAEAAASATSSLTST